MTEEQRVIVVKSAFKDNESLLKSMRRFFFQMPLDAMDLSNLTVSFSNKEVLEVVKDLFLPALDADKPIGLQRDILFEIDLKGMDPGKAILHIRAIRALEAYFEQQFELLASGEYQKRGIISLESLKEINDLSDDDIFVRTFTRLLIISHVEKNISWLHGRANEKEKTPEEVEKEKKKNSTK